MKYIKTFENVDKPEVGDYIVVDSLSSDSDVKNFMDYHVAQIEDFFGWDIVTINYNSVPRYIRHFFGKLEKSGTFGNYTVYRKQILIDEIISFSKSREEMEELIETRKNANKYNL